MTPKQFVKSIYPSAIHEKVLFGKAYISGISVKICELGRPGYDSINQTTRGYITFAYSSKEAWERASVSIKESIIREFEK